MMRWRLHHHRALLDVIQGNSRQSPEEAIVIHLRIGYNEPERFSSLAVCSNASAEASTSASDQ
jgi:hypothetical protein